MFAPFCCLTVKCGRGPLLPRSLPPSIDSDNNEQVNCFRDGGFARKSHQLITRAPNCVVTDRNCTGRASVFLRLCCSCLNNVGCLLPSLSLQSQVRCMIFHPNQTSTIQARSPMNRRASTASKQWHSSRIKPSPRNFVENRGARRDPFHCACKFPGMMAGAAAAATNKISNRTDHTARWHS